jgi:hypothetical protein
LAFALLYPLSGSSQQTNLGGFMKKSTMILAGLILAPAFVNAQVFSWEAGILEQQVVVCNKYSQTCTPTEINEGCTHKCISYISIGQLTNVLLGQANKSASLEAGINSVRSDIAPSLNAHAAEINNIKTSLSSAEIQRMIQKAVREELTQRGL